MHGRALSPSPIAMFLLGLAERGADGSVDIGGRLVLLRKGHVVDVRAAEGDGDLVAFLRDSGRVAPEPLERCIARAREESMPLEEMLIRQRLLGAETMKDVRRGLWLDRLVRGMARAAAEGREPTPVYAETRIPASDSGSTSLVILVLDALERRAADQDAGQVGSRADHHLEWQPGPHEERAKRWARFSVRNSRPSIAALLKTEPAAAPRIAALVRAGLARIVSPETAPAPHPRSASIPVAPPTKTRNTPPLGFAAAPVRTAPRRRKPSVELDPGLSPIFGDEPLLDTELPSFPSPSVTLDDPLDDLERTIAVLEQKSAPGAERAAAWRAFARMWEERFGSLEEAARAYREAAAADSGDREALERASELCAALAQADLAVAYARASVSVAPEGPERAQALWRYALLCRRLGKVSEAIGALRAAAAADPRDPEPLTLMVHLWRELGRTADAAKTAVEAADRVWKREPARALSLAALALALDPNAAGRAEAYAAELARNGLAEAAIAVLAAAVRRTPDADARRALLLAAAEQAEIADRPDIAAELLLRAFDAEPHVDVLYEPLDADLAAAEATLERALLLEEIAAVNTSPDTQGAWLTRAAEARLGIPGDGTWETELRTRALELEPESETGASSIREQAVARDDPRLLADALERTIARGHWTRVESQGQALEELAALTEDALNAPLRAASAWERLRAIMPDDPAPLRQLARLAQPLEDHRRRRKQLEDALAAAGGELRIDAARRLADHVRDDPERRRRAISLYREVLEARPSDAEAGDALERLYKLSGDDAALAELLALRAEHATSRADRLRLRGRAAGLAVLRGAFDEAIEICRRILAELPTHREATLRLRRAASRLGDHDLLREALGAEARVAMAPQARARVLTSLALELEEAESYEEAISCAEAALTADPTSAEAALLVTRHLEDVRQPRAALGVVRALFGDSPPILEAWARVARDSGERDAMLEALEAWAAVAPYDPQPWEMRLSAFPAADQAESLRGAIEGALAPEHCVPSLARPIATAITRLGELGELAAAAELATRAADSFGPNGDALRELAGQLANASGDPRLRRAALERRLAPHIDEPRVELLHELATLHHEANDLAAEARTHLRVLAVSAHDAHSLDRLQSIYAMTGEHDRLLAALALSLEAAPESNRITPLLRLAAASAQLRNDLDRAEAFLRDACRADQEDESALLTAAGALVTLGRARRAVEMLREAGRRLPPKRAGAVFLRAVQLALKRVDDPRLALSAAVEGLHHAPSSGQLLLAFEQIALELSDIDIAERTYGRLLERSMGPHGRRALAYRRARWLERAGGGKAALAAFLEAFEREPQGGVVYASIERLARQEGDLESLVRAALVLAERGPHPAVRASMAREAAKLLETEIGSKDRAFEVLADLWEAGDGGVEADLMRIAAEVSQRDPARGEAAFARLVEGLRKRAGEAWMADAKARLLARLGRLHALGRRDLGAAEAAIDEALAALRAEGGEADLTAELDLELASWLFEAGRVDAAGDRVRDALRARPDHEGALALAGQLGLIRPGAEGPDTTRTAKPKMTPGPLPASQPLGSPTPPLALATPAQPMASPAQPISTAQPAASSPTLVTLAVAPAVATPSAQPAASAAQPQIEPAAELPEPAIAPPGPPPARQPEALRMPPSRPTPAFGSVAAQPPPARKVTPPMPLGIASSAPVPSEEDRSEEATPREPPLFSPKRTPPRVVAEPEEPELSFGSEPPPRIDSEPPELTFETRDSEVPQEPSEPRIGFLPEEPEPIRSSLIPTLEEQPRVVVEPMGLAEPPAEDLSLDFEPPELVLASERPRVASVSIATPQPIPAMDAQAIASAAARRSTPSTVAIPENRGAVATASATRVLVPPKRAPSDRPPEGALARWSAASPPSPSGPESDTVERDALALVANAPDRALPLLRGLLTREPHRLSVARALAEAAARVGAGRIGAYTCSLLSLVDPHRYPPTSVPPPPPEHLSALLHETAFAPHRQIWRMLWEQALPLFREGPPRLPHPNDRVTRVATTPEARAFSAALDALARHELPAFYFDRQGEATIYVVRTSRPCILAGPGFASDESSMRFALGRVLELAEPENLLVATLERERAEVVIAAVSAAFGPADGAPSVSRAAASLASELWRTMAPRGQAAMRELVLSTEKWDDYENTRRAVEESGLRAGLVACGDLAAALRAVREQRPALHSLSLEGESALSNALQISSELASLVRFALGPLS